MTLPTYLLWIDLETTGLDFIEHEILEVSATLVPFETPFYALAPWVDVVVRRRMWNGLSEDVISMHAKSGLIGDCFISERTLSFAEKSVRDLIPEDAKPGTILLAGSTVFFDLGFVRKNFPTTIAPLLHHRVYDVSAVRNFAYSLGMPEDVKEEAPHRARKDLERSMALGSRLAVWFQDHFWKRELELRRNHSE